MKIKLAVVLSLSAALALTPLLCVAQSGDAVDIPDWEEEQTPPPPSFSTINLIPIEMPRHITVRVGVDPETIAVGRDGVVRYVIVMTNSTGSTYAVYEGIRCDSDEVKTYARLGASGQWSTLVTPVWKPLNDNMPSHHAQAFARQGACQDRIAVNKKEIISALKSGRRAGQDAKTN